MLSFALFCLSSDMSLLISDGGVTLIKLILTSISISVNGRMTNFILNAL